MNLKYKIIKVNTNEYYNRLKKNQKLNALMLKRQRMNNN